MQPKEQIALLDEDRSPVSLNRTGEVWSLYVSPDISWDEARARIADGLEEMADELRGRNLRVNLGDRPLDLMEIRRLGSLMRDCFKAAIIGLECTPDNVHRYAGTSLQASTGGAGARYPASHAAGFHGCSVCR